MMENKVEAIYVWKVTLLDIFRHLDELKKIFNNLYFDIDTLRNFKLKNLFLDLNQPLSIEISRIDELNYSIKFYAPIYQWHIHVVKNKEGIVEFNGLKSLIEDCSTKNNVLI